MSDLSQFSPGAIWPDTNGVHINAHGGGILRHGGNYYWFGEHRSGGEESQAAQVGVHVYRSADLYSWEDQGIALAVSDDPQSDITRGCFLERPKVIYNAATGKFVMWFHLELKDRWYDAARVGVAVADRPAGPYQFLKSFRPDAGVWPQNEADDLKKLLTPEQVADLAALPFEGPYFPEYPTDMVFRRDFAGGQMSRDMTLFLDDDGQAYHIRASEENGTLHISQLSDDFLSSAGRYVRIFPKRFHEAPAVMKRKGTYFLISSDCTGWAPNAARLASAPSIWGPWTELGNPCVGTSEQQATTFQSQSTFILQVADRPDEYIFMADRWCPENAIDGRYIWLPIKFENDVPRLEWADNWKLSEQSPLPSS